MQIHSDRAIKIVALEQPITDFSLRFYLKKRGISEAIANHYCSEVSFELNNRIYTAIGFKNTAGGYELKSEFLKDNTSPKYVAYLNNLNKKSITVFEDFFDFLSYQVIHQNQIQLLTNFLVLNSLDFFERSLLVMEKDEQIFLYLRSGESGRKCARLARKRYMKYQDRSRLCQKYKSLNDWIVNTGQCNSQRSLTEDIINCLFN